MIGIAATGAANVQYREQINYWSSRTRTKLVDSSILAWRRLVTKSADPFLQNSVFVS